MDKKYLEEQMSAYLDGELSPGEMSKYEQEIKAYPDLFAELQTLQRLNKLAEGSKLAMPDDRYFENLAGRIDKGIANQPAGQSRIVEFFLLRRKSVAIISSAAAVLLVVLIGMNMFGPDAKRYPNQLPSQRSIESPAILDHRVSDTNSAASSVDLKQPPAPEVKEEVGEQSLGGRQAQNQEIRIVDEGLSMEALSTIDTGVGTPTMPVKEIEKPAETDKMRKIPPSVAIKPGQLKKKNLSGESSGASPQSLSSFETPPSRIASVPERASDTVIIFTETIMPGINDSYGDLASKTADAATVPDLTRFHDSSGLSWSIYLGVFKELNEGMYRGWKLSASSRSLDSLQAWKDSISVLGPARWYAEQAFRSLQTKETTWDEYQKMRAYIDHYMAETQIPDSAVWNRRLPIVNDIYERQIGKQYRDKK